MICHQIPLWDAAYLEQEGVVGTPVLDTYLLEGAKTRGAVLICPGGGYQAIMERTAEPIALQFAAAGFHAFVLRYSVSPNRHPQPLRDASRAVCLIREHAETWNVDPERIAVSGFSAGGHVAASLAVHWHRMDWLDVPGIKAGRNRPNALILGYPVITAGNFAHWSSLHHLLGESPNPELLEAMSLETQVSDRMPPVFLWHTFADGKVTVENTLLFAQALRAGRIPFELHIYPNGDHGYSLATAETDRGFHPPDPHIASWMRLCIEWLDGLK